MWLSTDQWLQSNSQCANQPAVIFAAFYIIIAVYYLLMENKWTII